MREDCISGPSESEDGRQRVASLFQGGASIELTCRATDGVNRFELPIRNETGIVRIEAQSPASLAIQMRDGIPAAGHAERVALDAHRRGRTPVRFHSRQCPLNVRSELEELDPGIAIRAQNSHAVMNRDTG